MATIKEKQKNTFDSLKGEFEYKNVMQTPTVEKVIISVGVGSVHDKNKVKLIGQKLAKITGQKPVECLAKKSIATFKLREGMMVGYKTTLRGPKMWAFLEKLLNVALPRTRDFRGISDTAVDDMGNYTLGIKENTIFPETADEEIKDVFGMAITIVTTASNKKETQSYLKHLGFPFKKD